jgi:hypothetical protein
LAINLDPNQRAPRSGDRNQWSGDRSSRPICLSTGDTQGRPGQNPVIALSFTELLERMLDEGWPPYWLVPQYVGYGDAEEYTRRDAL